MANFRAPVWPDYDTLVKSVNNRSSFYGRPQNDPLFGIQITQDMWDRAVAARYPKPKEAPNG